MESKRDYTEKDFPIQARMLYVWLLLVLLFSLSQMFAEWDSVAEPSFWVYAHSRVGDFIALAIVGIPIGIFFWKRKGFLVGGEGIQVNPRFFGGTSNLVLYTDIARTYIQQGFIEDRLGVTSVCVEMKPTPLTRVQKLLQQFSTHRRKYSVCISGLLPNDAESLRLVIEERANNLTLEDTIREEKAVVARTDGANWFSVICLTLFFSWLVPIIIPWFQFSSDIKNIFFWFIPPLLTFLSYKYWRLFFSEEPKSPHLAYLTVYAVALLLIVVAMAII
jgi:hypothetical protein